VEGVLMPCLSKKSFAHFCPKRKKKVIGSK
jgi:hypothetical protein